MRSSISIILILFLFSSPSPQDQNAEEQKSEEEPLPPSSATSDSEAEAPPASPSCDADTEAQILLSSATSPLIGLETITEDILGPADESLEGQHENEPMPQENITTEDIPEEQVTSTSDEGVVVHSALDMETESITEEKVKTEEERTTTESPVPVEVNKSEDSIPSFSEWTKLQLAQRKESIINNIKNKSSVLEGKNFASPDCGAKVINSNQESQNPSGVISSSHDEYMLNRCTTNVWFIMELCEPLTIERLTLGNLELFSSNPHEFEVGVSDRYPTRDWVVFGPYFAPDSRNLHSFHLPPNNSTFGKYLRIVVKSHHGNEHYCPLSLIKVYGRSEYEVLESETTHAQDMDAEIPGIIEEEMNDDDKPVENSVIGTATAVVMNMVKKAADVLVSKSKAPEDTKAETSEKIDPPPTPPPPSTCISLWQCLYDSESRAAILQLLSCRRNDLKWMETLLRWCGWQVCQKFLQWNSIGSPSTVEGLLISIYGSTVIPALCHFKYPLKICQKTPTPDILRLAGAPNETLNGSISDGEILLSSNGHLPGHIPGEDEPIGLSMSEDTPPGISPEVPGNNFQLPTPPPPVEEPAQKESVFVRLSNRIKALERNQSLSSGYLEELSQRFKKQSEEMHSAHEIFRKSLNDSLSKCTYLESTLRYEVRKLNRNLETLRDLIWRLELQRSGFLLLSLLQIISTCFLWWNRKGQRSSDVKDQPYVRSGSLKPLRHDSECMLSGTRQRKRSCSQPPNTKQKKKKKRKEGGSVGALKSLDNIGNRIPNSLSTGSIPLRLPSSALVLAPVSGGAAVTPARSPKFEFSGGLIQPNFNGGPAVIPRTPTPTSNNSLSLMTTPPSGQIKGGFSSSDVSESSSTKSHKKKSKFKSFFFWK